MTIFLIAIHVIVCLILILVILLQAGRGQGLTGGSFGSGNVQSLLGTRAADFLTKATSVAAICFLFTCIGLNILETQRSKSLFEVTQKSAPVDIETIKKALEKVKAEKAQETPKSSPRTGEKTDTPRGAVAIPPPPAAADGKEAKNNPQPEASAPVNKNSQASKTPAS